MYITADTGSTVDYLDGLDGLDDLDDLWPMLRQRFTFFPSEGGGLRS